ncbi:tRNA (N(6)-L-threonylcarbamoyladenosine(37)-C(2))-methylthiotransferase MtaB [Parabacteroides sp. OttesenSCG-928-N08]|nr:tRNA (N(6)-L-threonylcarbamoyladenosine(37)-C(2))-methylthiotransferase MtaB [Parabacteroides sp. OttesenSCG-928-N08]
MTDPLIFQNKSAAYFTLGCKLNFAETSTIGKSLAQQGVRKARTGEAADICVINTCSVTELADKKCRQAIRRFTAQHPVAYVIVTGCYAQLKPDEVASIPGVDLVLGSEQKIDILHYLDTLEKQKEGRVVTSASKDIRQFSPSCSADDRTRHFLKVQDGCDYYCTYCTIPFARGRSRNGSIASLVSQAQQVASKGGKEIVLTGINIGDFGKSTDESFLDLIRALDAVEGISRYRISSIEPNLITDEAIDFVAQSRRFAPHFHIPLQSGSDDVLRLMHRRYDTALFRHKIEKIKEVMPHAFIGVDVIVGTRGESDSFFRDSLEFIDSLPISQLHVFSYSERAGTQALKIENPVDPKDKQLRSKQLLDISERKLADFYQAYIGSTAEVLFEHTRRGGRMSGFTANYIKVEAPYQSALVNEITPVRLAGWNEEHTALLTDQSLSDHVG